MIELFYEIVLIRKLTSVKFMVRQVPLVFDVNILFVMKKLPWLLLLLSWLSRRSFIKFWRHDTVVEPVDVVLEPTGVDQALTAMHADKVSNLKKQKYFFLKMSLGVDFSI